MKKILISLITFALGLTVYYFTIPKQTAEIQEFTAVQKIEEMPDIQTEISIEKETDEKETENENLKPFFDLFDGSKAYDEEMNYQGFSGWFIADDFKGMKEVWTILLNRNDENSKNEKLIWSAHILTNNPDGSPNDEADFHSISIKTEKDKLSFRTNKIRGIEYRFEGKFFKSGKNFDEDEKVLKGTMQKFVKGKKVAEFNDDFAYNEPRCFH